jgi:hypothetical protein
VWLLRGREYSHGSRKRGSVGAWALLPWSNSNLPLSVEVRLACARGFEAAVLCAGGLPLLIAISRCRYPCGRRLTVPRGRAIGVCPRRLIGSRSWLTGGVIPRRRWQGRPPGSNGTETYAKRGHRVRVAAGVVRQQRRRQLNRELERRRGEQRDSPVPARQSACCPPMRGQQGQSPANTLPSTPPRRRRTRSWRQARVLGDGPAGRGTLSLRRASHLRPRP